MSIFDLNMLKLTDVIFLSFFPPAGYRFKKLPVAVNIVLLEVMDADLYRERQQKPSLSKYW